LRPILIVDDDPRNTFALSAVLKTKGYKTFISGNMVEAFAPLESEKEIGIILLDMMIPGMDGYDAMPVLRSTEAYKHLPLIAVTAQAMPGDREKCIAAGADDDIAKPVDVNSLLQVLDKYLK